MAENKVRFLRGTAQEYNDAVKDEDAFYFTTDDGRLYIGDKEISGDGSITIDTALSDTSTNPVQNKVINAALNEKADQTTVDSLLSNKLDSSDFNNHANNTAVHVTSAEKAAWSAVNYSNPNLLINPDFAVNQRGQTEYTASGYTVDRWQITASSKLTPHDGYITFESTVDKATAPLYQKCENPAALSGKTVVLSFDYDLKTEGAWISVQAVTNGSWNPVPAAQLTDTGRSVKSTVITLPENLTELRLALVIHSTDSAPFAVADIYGAKLELGKIATPIIPADPATELAKCQRYYQLRSTGDIDPTDLRPTMRTITDIRQREDGKYEYIAEL